MFKTSHSYSASSKCISFQEWLSSKLAFEIKILLCFSSMKALGLFSSTAVLKRNFSSNASAGYIWNIAFLMFQKEL